MSCLRSFVIILILAAGCAPRTGLLNTPSSGAAWAEPRIDSVFAHFGPTTPGCAVGVFRAGEIVFAKGYGAANLEHGIPITRETVFDIASISKQFTAFAVLLLARQGKLSLDDDVRKHVPELPDVGAVITLRHMIHNVSGLPDYGMLRFLSQAHYTHESPLTRGEAMELLTRQRGLSFQPGERYLYSNTNWLLLAIVVERVDGRAFRDYMEQEVFRPLGMARTLVRDDPMRIVPGRAVNYTPLEGGEYRINFEVGLHRELGGPAYMHSTLGDLAHWDANFYDEGLGGAGAVGVMYTRGVLNSGDTIHYAAGLEVMRHRGLRVVGHTGSSGGSAEFIRFPEHRLSVAVLCNQPLEFTPVGRYARDVADLFLPPPSPPASLVVVDSQDLTGFAGRFVDPESGQVMEFVVQDGVLVEKDGSTTWPLNSLGQGMFEDDGVRLEFSADRQELLFLGKNTKRRARLIRADGEPWRPTLVDLSAYPGVFTSNELEISWQILVVDEAVTLRRKGVADEPLQPLLQDRFLLENGWLVTFARGVDGSVTGLTVNTSRVLNVRFARVSDG